MAPRRGRSTAPRPRRPETAAELAAVLQTHAIKQLDRGTGRAVDWTVMAEAMALAMFKALDEVPEDPKALNILRRLHSAAYTRLAAHPLIEPEIYQPNGGRSLLNTFGQAAPSPEPDGRPR